MNAKSILIAASALLLAASATAKSPKRGVSENQFQFKAQLAALEPGVSWYYSWGNTAGGYLANEKGIDFVPMCWNADYNADKIRAFVEAHPEVEYLLGFNEPNFTNQADMTPAEAAAAWPAVQALAKELNLKLVAPALNYSPNPPYYQPTVWMDEFVELVGKDAFDYVAVHAYGGFSVMKDLATQFHERYGKDVWVTEFCYWPEEGNPNSTVSQESQVAFMMEALEWLEKTPWIYKYAWFKAVGNSDAALGPNYGLLMPGKAEDERELSQQGLVYVYLGDFDEDVWHPTNQTVAAADYITQKSALLGKSNDPDCPSPIEIVKFSSGASIDYQFDVPADGTYTLNLKVSGFGEPTRFDPCVSVSLVEGDEVTELAAAKRFPLTNSDSVYVNVQYTLDLKAGHRTLRLADKDPYSPSGLRFSTLALNSELSGIEDVAISAEQGSCDVYSLTGIKVRTAASAESALEGLPAGVYIVNGKKTIKQ